MSESHFNYFPQGLSEDLLRLDDLDLLRVLERPTLVRVPGAGDAPARGIACLLHGDEDTGYRAALHVLRRRRAYPFDLYLIVGNVQAAIADGGFRHRFLDDQEDFNRVWGREPTTGQRLAAAGILAELQNAQLTTLVDIHNNSGSNPFYAIVTDLRPEALNVAAAFTTTILHWGLKAGTIMEALGDGCAAVAVECGLPAGVSSLSFAVDGLRRYLRAPDPRENGVVPDYDLLGQLRKVTVRPGVRFAFGGEPTDQVDFVVEQDADRYNFRPVPAGHLLGRVPPGSPVPVQVLGPEGEDLTEDHVEVRDGRVLLRCPVTPVMMTRTPVAARKDCLFYLARPQPLPHHS